MARKAAPKKTELEQDRETINAIMTRTDKKPLQRGLRKTLIMAVRQLDDLIQSQKK